MTDPATGLARLVDRLDRITGEHLPPADAQLVTALARPAVRLQTVDRATSSHLGGAARLAPGDRWPERDGTPLALLAVIDLAELAPFVIDRALPPSGLLNVFYEYEEQPWGFDPDDRSGWRLHLVDPVGAVVTESPAPTTFASFGLSPTQILTIPGWEEPAVESIFPAHEDTGADAQRRRDAYFAMQDAWCPVVDWEAEPLHLIGGWPRLVQSSIWYECESVSRGQALGTADDAATAATLPDRSDDWTLLLQLDSDEDPDWMWGDSGTLYFATRRSLAPPVAFAEAWMTLQCT